MAIYGRFLTIRSPISGRSLHGHNTWGGEIEGTLAVALRKNNFDLGNAPDSSATDTETRLGPISGISGYVSGVRN